MSEKKEKKSQEKAMSQADADALAGIAALADYAAETMTDDPDQYVFITHGDCEDEAKKLAAMLQEKTGVKNFVFNMVGPVIANHTGPGMIGVFFVGKTDRQ